MVTVNQVQAGVTRFIDTDILPHLTGVKKIGLGIYSALAAQNVTGMVMKYKDHPAIDVLNVVDKEGNVDIDRLYQAAAPMFANGERHTITIPLIGDMTIDKTDLEKLYRYVKEGI